MWSNAPIMHLPHFSLEKLVYSVSFIYYPIVAFRVIPSMLLNNSKPRQQKVAFIHLLEHFAILLFHFFSVVYMIKRFDVSWDFLLFGDTSMNDGARYLQKHAEVDSFIVATMCFYLSSAAVLWMPPVKHDRVTMTIHHIATFLLMLPAYLSSFIDITIWVLFVNSLADIFLEASKIAVKYNFLYNMKMDAVVFTIFIGIHFVFRCVVYPYKIYITAYNSWERMHTLASLLSVSGNVPLFFLNIYWLFKIWATCARRLSQGKREVDDSETTEENLKTE